MKETVKQLRDLYNEIDRRISHGADSNGHLEYVQKRLKALKSLAEDSANTDEQIDDLANFLMKEYPEEIGKDGISEGAAAGTPDGWIPHNGGECPVDDDVMVEAKFRDGLSIQHYAHVWNWGMNTINPGDNIIAYRVIEPKTTTISIEQFKELHKHGTGHVSIPSADIQANTKKGETLEERIESKLDFALFMLKSLTEIEISEYLEGLNE